MKCTPCTCHEHESISQWRGIFGRTTDNCLRFMFFCPAGKLFDIYDVDDSNRSGRKFARRLRERMTPALRWTDERLKAMERKQQQCEDALGRTLTVGETCDLWLDNFPWISNSEEAHAIFDFMRACGFDLGSR